MMDTKANYTLCFYENPAALHDIKAWEELKFNQIIAKEVQPDGTRMYLIALAPEDCDGYLYEVLYCTPIGLLTDPKNLGAFRQQMLSFLAHNLGSFKVGSLHYYKTIIFGQVRDHSMMIISEMMRNAGVQAKDINKQ